MKNINKRSDARSYSPLSFLGTSHISKASHLDNPKSKQSQLDLAAALSFKPQKNPLNYQKANLGSNYTRKTRKNNASVLNQTMVHDECQRNSSYEETLNNLSYVDGSASKNVSYQIESLQSGFREKTLRNFNTKRGNTPLGNHKHNNSYGGALFPQEYPLESNDGKAPSKGDHGIFKRDEKSYQLNSFSRRHNESSFIYPPSSTKQKDEILFPKIKNPRNSKGREEAKQEKMIFMERTYSLSPYKQKTNKPSTPNQNQNPELKLTDGALKSTKANKTQEQFYKSKLPFEITRKGRENKGVRGRPFQIISKFETPKTQAHSPIEDNTSKHVVSAILHKDQSWGGTSIKTNTSQVKINSQYYFGSSKELSVSSLNKSNNNSKVMEKNDESSFIDEVIDGAVVGNYYKAMDMTISKQISDFSQKDVMPGIPKILIEHAPSSNRKSSKRAKGHSKTRVEVNNRFHTIANNSVTNMFESVDISSPREVTSSGKNYKKSQNQTEVGSPELTPIKKNYSEDSRENNWHGLERNESHENVLDDFAEKSMMVSIQDQNQSFVSSTGKPQFDEMLETSLISYLNDKDKVQEKSRKEIESTLSMSKHPMFKRSKVVVSKGINSLDKEHPYMASTNVSNSKSTYKNESCQLKNEKEEFFQAESSLEKSRTLEVDFNFAEDTSNSTKKKNLMGDHASPSFPGQRFNLQPVPTQDGSKLRNKKMSSRNKREGNLDNGENFEIVTISQEEIEENQDEQDEDTPTANSSFVKPIIFNTPNKLNPFPEIEELEQSFNENPMDSMNNLTPSMNQGEIKYNFERKELSFKDSTELQV